MATHPLVEKPLRYRKDLLPWLMMKMRFKTVFSVKTWADQLAFILAIFLVAGVPCRRTGMDRLPQRPVRANVEIKVQHQLPRRPRLFGNC